MTSYSLRIPVWLVPLAIAGLVAVLGFWGNDRLRATLEEELSADLSATLDANVTALEIWISDQEKLATALAEEPTLRALALQTLLGQTVPTHDLDAYLRARLDGLGYEIAYVASTNFVLVADSERSATRGDIAIADAHVAKFAELFANGKPVVITPFKPRHRVISRPVPTGSGAAKGDSTGTSSPPRFAASGGPPESPSGSAILMQVAAPIRDDQGRVRGALALALNPDKGFSRILSVARSGKSGETYVFDQNGLMLSRSRFEEKLRDLGLIANKPGASSAATLSLRDPGLLLKTNRANQTIAERDRPLIQLVRNGVAGGTGLDLEASRDYRGVPVVGAWRWVPRHGFGVVTQMDADEAFKPLRVLNLLFIMLFLLVVLCAIALFLASILGAKWKRRLTEAELKLKQLGQYTLDKKIGEGAMGVVYRAHHALMRRETAVKLLLPDRADLHSIQRFEREVRLSCRLTHPNTIQVYDYGHTPDGVFYYAMELLAGLNLYQLVSEFGPQPEGRVVYILTQVCDALAEAHALGLVHRDLKPGNIFLCDRGGVPDWVKVLDFGLVQGYREGTRSRPVGAQGGQAEGTPLFMPPEAFQDSVSADPRSDIYSLGAVGYFLLTAQYVFEGDSDLDLYRRHATERPPPPSRRTHNPISAEMEETLLRCLEKESNLRVQSVGELRQLLMTSPLAAEWGTEARAAWWAAYHASSHPALTTGPPSPPESAEETVKISFIERVPL